MEGHPPKKRSLSDTSLSLHSDSISRKFPRTVKLPLSEEQHNELDQRVLRSSGIRRIVQTEFDIDDAMLLLAHIVDGAQDFMDPNLAEPSLAMKCLTENPGLQKILQDALMAGSFRTIRELAILQAAPVSAPTQTPSPSQFKNQDLHMNAITSAWNEPLNKSLHVLLNKNINSMRRDVPYSNFVSIVQSSGTGKSRMVHEQSDIVFTIPFCLWDEFDRDLPYPLADDKVRDYLTRYNPRDDFDDIRARFFVFLRHLFEAVRNTLVELYVPKEPAASYNALATSWRTYLETGARTILYDTVVRKATEGWQGIDKTVEEFQDKALGFDPIRIRVASYEAKHEFESLLSSIDACVSCKGTEDVNRLKPDAIKLVIYFDKAHVLRARQYHYDALCSCFTYFVGRPIFFIFLSTNPSLEFFETESSTSSSARFRDSNDAFQAPITELPFDCAPELLVLPHTVRLQDVCSIEFMSQFGRPLWWTLVNGAGQRKDEMLAKLVDLARSKLICKRNLRGSYAAALTPAARLAVVDVRLMLHYGPQKEAILLEAELVASHMRIAYSIPQSQTSLWSGYSSEPILGEAAAQQMHTFRQDEPSALIDILKENIQGGLIERGLRGELVARAIVVSAYDRAVEVDHPSPEAGRPPLYSQGCSVITFIRELFREEYANEILESVPDNASNSVKFRDAFEHAKIRFTQFVKMGDDTGNTSAAMYAGFVRGYAAICYTGQKMVDFMLPVLLWDELLCEEVMSAIMIKAKRQMGGETKFQMYKIEESEIGFFPPSTESDRVRPYIALIMELGQCRISEETKARVRVRETVPNLKAAKTTAKTPSPSTLPKIPPTLSKAYAYIAKSGMTKSDTESNHPRYNIFAHGCSSTLYKVVEPSQKGKYAFVLGYGDILDDHARQSPESLQAVQTLMTGSSLWIPNDSSAAIEYDKPDESWLVTGCGLESDEDMSGSDEDMGVFDEGTNV